MPSGGKAGRRKSRRPARERAATDANAAVLESHGARGSAAYLWAYRRCKGHRLAKRGGIQIAAQDCCAGRFVDGLRKGVGKPGGEVGIAKVTRGNDVVPDNELECRTPKGRDIGGALAQARRTQSRRTVQEG